MKQVDRLREDGKKTMKLRSYALGETDSFQLKKHLVSAKFKWSQKEQIYGSESIAFGISDLGR